MIIVITGPTAVGKTKLSIELAKKYNAEIINSDSVQVYKKIDVASAKVTEEEKESIVHHLLDIKEYDEDYTVYVYFEDGKIVCYDAKPLLDKKAFAPLKNIDFFMNACTILNDTLAWDVSGDRDCSKCLDIDPDMLHSLENVEEKIA